MSYYDDASKPGRVAEPAQVYLDPDDQDRLARLTTRLETTKSDILRRGLAALERELTDPASHPAIRLIGIGRAPGDGDDASDAARDHDEVLARSEEASWKGVPRDDESSGGGPPESEVDERDAG